MSYRQWNFASILTATKRNGPRLAGFQARRVAWEIVGCSPHAAEALAQNEIDGIYQITSLGRGFFERFLDCDCVTVAEIGSLIGGWPGNPENDHGRQRRRSHRRGRPGHDRCEVEHNDATGLRHRDHAFAGLSIADAVRLQDALASITAAMNSDPRQASLWPRRSGR